MRKITVSNSCFFPSCFFKPLSLGFFYKTLNHFSALFFSLEFFFILREAHYYLERERERERDGWCVYSSQRRRWQNDDSDDEHFYDDQEEEEELARRRLGGAKKEIESKENG